MRNFISENYIEQAILDKLKVAITKIKIYIEYQRTSSISETLYSTLDER